MEILYVLLVLLVVTRIGAEIAERAGQAALVGELVAGIILGVVAHHYSDVLPVISEISDDAVFTAVTDLGIFFLMLFAGVELKPRDLTEGSRGAIVVAFGGAVVPLAMGMGLGWIFLPDSELKPAQTLFLGVAMAVTAIPVAIKVLLDLGQMNTRVGRMIVSAAVIDDVLSLLLLAALTGVIRSGSLPDPASIGLLVLKVASFFIVAIAIGVFVFPRAAKMLKRARVDEFEFSALLIAALAYALLAEALELHFIMGAFIAGLFFSHQTPNAEIFENVKGKLSGITFGFLAPVFFASIGLHISFAPFVEIPGFLALLVAAAFLGKLIGAGLTALPFGFSQRDAYAIGVGMSGRGAVELIIADIALKAGLFSTPGSPTDPIVSGLFSAVVVMAVVTTLLVPIVLRRTIGSGDDDAL